MSSLDETTCREWLNLELDGQLEAGQRLQLDEHLEAHPELARERRQLTDLDRLLTESRVAARPELVRQVMTALPTAGWEARHPRTWRWAVALLLALGAGAAALVGSSSAQMAPDSPLLGALSAVAGLLGAAVMTAAGLLSASWKGLGLAVSELLAGSPTAVGAFALFVVSLNLLFIALLRGRRRAAETAQRDGSGRR